MNIELTVRPGDILLTRNAREEDNSSPGYWNHAAVVAYDSTVVEAQADPGTVIRTDWRIFYDRYPQIVVMRPTSSLVEKIVETAYALVGKTKYKKAASVWSLLSHRRDNCVTVIRKCWLAATREDPRWRIPDQIRESDLLTLVAEKMPGPSPADYPGRPEDFVAAKVQYDSWWKERGE